MFSPRQYIEIFHLVFLSHFGRHADKALYAVKGGCNLRFFYNSPRYSEDLDIDIKTIAPNTLRSKTNKIVQSTPFVHSLVTKGLTLTRFSEPKQTDTVQRWKFELHAENISAPLHTKIEFSRRGIAPGTEFGMATPSLTMGYQMPTILLSHYGKNAAFLQKIAALIGRSETQARDVFDLNLLWEAGARPKLNPELNKNFEKACSNAASCGFSDFKGQVLAYLEPTHQEYWKEQKTWSETIAKLTSQIRNLAT